MIRYSLLITLLALVDGFFFVRSFKENSEYKGFLFRIMEKLLKQTPTTFMMIFAYCILVIPGVNALLVFIALAYIVVTWLIALCRNISDKLDNERERTKIGKSDD